MFLHAHAQYAKNIVRQKWKAKALRFFTTLLLHCCIFISVHAHTRKRPSPRRRSISPRWWLYLLQEAMIWAKTCWGFFPVETAGGWLILYLKGSGLDSRLLAQRKSIVDVEVTQAAFKQTVGSHLSGIRVCVTWRRRCNSSQFCPQEGKVPEGFWRPCWRDFSLLLPTPVEVAAAHICHKLSSEQEVEVDGHKFTKQVQAILLLTVLVGFVKRQSDPLKLSLNVCVCVLNAFPVPFLTNTYEFSSRIQWNSDSKGNLDFEINLNSICKMFSHSKMRLQTVSKLIRKDKTQNSWILVTHSVRPWKPWFHKEHITVKFKFCKMVKEKSVLKSLQAQNQKQKQNTMLSAANPIDLKQNWPWPFLWQWNWSNLCLGQLPCQRLDSGRLPLFQLC